ncbi:hypothetical protein NEAUS03_0817 [Nematocida ausubeli]|nr:hypothetical protein NEAUS03_0817 [Nematocida ausubeli]
MIIRYSRKNKREEIYTGMGSAHIERRGSLKYALLSMWVLSSLGVHICTLYKLQSRNVCCSNSAPALPAVQLQEEGVRKSMVEEKKKSRGRRSCREYNASRIYS